MIRRRGIKGFSGPMGRGGVRRCVRGVKLAYMRSGCGRWLLGAFIRSDVAGTVRRRRSFFWGGGFFLWMEKIWSETGFRRVE